MNGWIKLHKSIMDHWLWGDPVVIKAWLDLLLSVNYMDKKVLFNGRLITVKKGQIITSIRKLTERWGCTRRKANNIITMFAEDGMIDIKRDKGGTLLTIVNYSIYQDVRDTDSTTESTTQDTTQGTTQSTQHKNIKNYKEYKNNREGKSRAFTAPSIEEISIYCRERNNGVDPQTFYDFYESKGWFVGKNKMKDWKAAVRTWEKREKEKPQPKNAALNYEQRKYTDDDIAAIERKKLGIG